MPARIFSPRVVLAFLKNLKGVLTDDPATGQDVETGIHYLLRKNELLTCFKLLAIIPINEHNAKLAIKMISELEPLDATEYNRVAQPLAERLKADFDLD